MPGSTKVVESNSGRGSREAPKRWRDKSRCRESSPSLAGEGALERRPHTRKGEDRRNKALHCEHRMDSCPKTSHGMHTRILGRRGRQRKFPAQAGKSDRRRGLQGRIGEGAAMMAGPEDLPLSSGSYLSNIETGKYVMA